MVDEALVDKPEDPFRIQIVEGVLVKLEPEALPHVLSFKKRGGSSIQQSTRSKKRDQEDDNDEDSKVEG